MAVKCKFENCDVYRCTIRNQEFPSEVNEEFFQSFHLRNRENNDVQWLLIENSKVEKIPDGIGDVFKKLTKLWIENSNLKEISKENLRQFPNLKSLSLEGNQLEYLPGDLFEFNKKLEWIWLRNNRIKIIGPELLDGLPNLTAINLQNNENINIFYLKNVLSLTLNNLRDKIKSKCKLPPEFIFKRKGRQKNPNQNTSGRLCDLDKFLTLDDFKDFTIKVGPKDFKVHKLIFMARSPTFAEVIKNNPDADELVLTDIPVEVFESILDFVYTDEPPKNPKNAREIFAAAGKLKMTSLMEILAKVLIKELERGENLDTLLKIFNLGAQFEYQELKLKAFEEIKKQFWDRELKNELIEDPETLNALIEAKKMIMEFSTKKNVGSSSKHEGQRKRFRSSDSSSLDDCDH